MAKGNIGTRKKPKRGRPPKPGGQDPSITARLPPALVAEIEAWAKANGVARQEAIQRLLEQGLAAGDPARLVTKAAGWLLGR